MLFSCLHTEMSQERRTAGQSAASGPPHRQVTGPFDITKAQRLTTEAAYSGRLVKDPPGGG